ncbi:membrane protein YfhO [Candidatus Kryptobacter tengchongensis]|nr:membrane protein YfhO [Candidatus Kryptobacter tengchongensis]
MAEKKKASKYHEKKTITPNELINPKYHSIIYILLIVLALLVFFNEALVNEKIFISGDIVAFKSWSALSEDAKTQKVPLLWNPYIFSGMPGYASLNVGPERPFDLIGVIKDFIINTIASLFPSREVFDIVFYMVFYLIIMAIGTYLLSRQLGMSKFISFVVAFSMVFSTFFIVWITVGHQTKIITMAIFPYLLLLIEKTQKKPKLIHLIALIISLWLIFSASHIQMMFYIYLSVGLYYLTYLAIKIFKKENLIGLIRSAILFVFATIISIGIFLDKYLPVFEYNKYSIRGQPPIIEKIQGRSSETQKSGLDYDYATQWSFSPGEVLTFIIPSTYGFGWRNYNGVLTGGETVRLNTYFGPMPFTDAANYLGGIVVFLAVIGVIFNFRKETFVKFLTFLSLLSLLISFGKEFPLIYDLFFYYVPFFNRFRVPSMILSLVMFSVPLLAGYGLNSILNFYKNGFPEKTKILFRNLTIFSLALFVFSIIFKNFISDIYRSLFATDRALSIVIQNNFGFVNQELFNRILPYVYQFIFDNFLSDLRVFLGLSTILSALIYLLSLRKINLNSFNFGIALIVFFDLWRVDGMVLHYSNKEELISIYNPPDYVEYIKHDTTLYRVLELSGGQPVMSNHLALYRLQNVFGYHGAKMRIYQDLIDVAGITNPFVLNILNVKYVISDRYDSIYGNLVFNGTKKVIFNPNYLPRAFFVNRYQVEKPLNILLKMKNGEFNPKDLLFLEDTLNLKIDPPAENAYVEVVEYQIQKITLKAKATGNNLLFLSETWYPKWKCYIDGKETPIYKANYVFRAVVVPDGEHEIVFIYQDDKFELGSKISLALSASVLIGLLISLIPYVKKLRISRFENSHSRT